jgi:hypothetical protein
MFDENHGNEIGHNFIVPIDQPFGTHEFIGQPANSQPLSGS